MRGSKSGNQVDAYPKKFLIKPVFAALLCGALVTCAQAQSAEPHSTNESSTTTTDTSLKNTSPSRTTNRRTKSGNNSVDIQIVEALGPNGEFQPSVESEKESIQVNATTTRTVVRTYRWDVNGQRNLEQVTEEEARISTTGEIHVTRTSSESDTNGNLQVVQREVADTRETSPTAHETRTTTYLPNGNGDLIPSVQTLESQSRSADGRVEVKKTLLQPNSHGGWEVGEVKVSTISEDNKNRISDERISRADSEGRLSEVSRTVDKETETAAGEKSTTVETYFANTPGVASDGGLHLNRRATSIQESDSNGKTIEGQVGQPNPNDPNGGLRVSTKTKYTVLYGVSGATETRTTEARDVNGAFNVVSVETQKSDQVPAAQIHSDSSERPQ